MKRFKRLSQDTWNRSVSQVATASRVPSAEAELDRYLLESSSYNVESSLGFWLDRLNAYPMLAPLALDLVSVPASQAYVERVFSLCGDLCARKRNRASVSLERRVFLKFNNMLMKIHWLWNCELTENTILHSAALGSDVQCVSLFCVSTWCCVNILWWIEQVWQLLIFRVLTKQYCN